MRLVREKSKEWIKEFEIRYKSSLPLIIESLIAFYGEDWREHISFKLTNAQILFILSYDAYKATKEFPLNDLTKTLKHYFTYVNIVLRTMQRKGFGEARLTTKEIKLSSIIKYPRRSIEYDALDFFISDPTLGLTWFTDDEEIIVVLPVYFINDQIIFHEISHIFTSLDNGDNLFPNDVVDELINEIISRDILKIYQSRFNGQQIGTDLSIDHEYINCLFLMHKFYERFKPLIIEAIKKRDINILEVNLGAKSLQTYFSLVEKLFYKDII